LAQTFEQFLKGLIAAQARRLQTRALQWFLQIAIRSLIVSAINPNQEKDDGSPSSYAIGQKASFDASLYGKMILYVYDAKWKEKLPYWDAYPLVIPLRPSASAKRGAFLGLNMHYLPPLERAKLMQALLTTLNNTKDMNPRSQLRITYQVLEGASKFRAFRPCLKMYLFSHIKSKILVINPKHWNKVLMLPVARWQKASELKVWNDSMTSLQKAATKKKKKNK
jgi:hypothetical protein